MSASIIPIDCPARRILADMAQDLSLVLYIAGISPVSIDALMGVRKFCMNYLGNCSCIKIIDIYNNDVDIHYRSMAVPLLVRIFPKPELIVPWSNELIHPFNLLKKMTSDYI